MSSTAFARGGASGWPKKADAVCRDADKAMFAGLDRHVAPEVTARVSELTKQQRSELVAVTKIVRDAGTATARALGKLPTARAQRASAKLVIKAMQHSAQTQASAIKKVRKPPASMLVFDTAPPDETIAAGIDGAAALGAFGCSGFLADLLWSRDPKLLHGSTAAQLAALVISEGPAGFVLYRGPDPDAGPVDIAKAAADYQGPGQTVAEAQVQLEHLGFNAGYVEFFDKPNTHDYATVDVREFADPAGAAKYLESVRHATKGVYDVPEIKRAWGNTLTNSDGTSEIWVVFRKGARAFYVGLTGAVAYSKADVLALAQAQYERAAAAPAGASNTPEDAIAAAFTTTGQTYIGDCSTADPAKDVGSYCSLLIEDHGTYRVYGVGPVASEITDHLNVTQEGGQWVVID
jgi:hypothetical protein